MSCLFVPTPCVIPLRIPTFSESKTIDNTTKIEMLCDTELPNIEIFYTVDGTKPQPYAGIVQGSKTHRYKKPFCLKPGKITLKAMAIHSRFHSMCSNVITKTFYVREVVKEKKRKKILPKSKSSELEKPTSGLQEESVDTADNSAASDLDSSAAKDCNDAGEESEQLRECLEENDTKPVESDHAEENGNSCEQNLNELNVSSDGDAMIADSGTSCIAEIEVVETNSEEESAELESDNPGDLDVLPTHIQPGPNQLAPCEMQFQHCFFCKKINSMSSKYCDLCGKKLYKICTICTEHNPSIANFCQFCGEKLHSDHNSVQEKEESEKVCQSIAVLVQPDVDNKSIQVTSPLISKSVQTSSSPKRNVKANVVKQLPLCTPGRGYWRQQVDYICNHLKAHANNNLQFQKVIGAPALGKFISADCVESDGSVSIHMTFESLPVLFSNHS